MNPYFEEKLRSMPVGGLAETDDLKWSVHRYQDSYMVFPAPELKRSDLAYELANPDLVIDLINGKAVCGKAVKWDRDIVPFIRD